MRAVVVAVAVPAVAVVVAVVAAVAVVAVAVAVADTDFAVPYLKPLSSRKRDYSPPHVERRLVMVGNLTASPLCVAAAH